MSPTWRPSRNLAVIVAFAVALIGGSFILSFVFSDRSSERDKWFAGMESDIYSRCYRNYPEYGYEVVKTERDKEMENGERLPQIVTFRMTSAPNYYVIVRHPEDATIRMANDVACPGTVDYSGSTYYNGSTGEWQLCSQTHIDASLGIREAKCNIDQQTGLAQEWVEQDELLH